MELRRILVTLLLAVFLAIGAFARGMAQTTPGQEVESFQATNYPAPELSDTPSSDGYPAPGNATATLTSTVDPFGRTAEATATQFTEGDTAPRGGSGSDLFATEDAQMGSSLNTPASSQTVLPTITPTAYTLTPTVTRTPAPTQHTVTPTAAPQPSAGASTIHWQWVGVGLFIPLILLSLGFLAIAVYRAGQQSA